MDGSQERKENKTMINQYIKIKGHIIHLRSIKYVESCFTDQCVIRIGFKDGGATEIKFVYDSEAREKAFELLEEALMNLD